MRISLSVLLLVSGFILASTPAETKPVRAQHTKPTANQAATEHTEEDEDDGWSGPVPRTQRGSRWYGHGIGWSVSPDGYYATPAAPAYHDGTVAPGYAFDGAGPEN